MHRLHAFSIQQSLQDTDPTVQDDNVTPGKDGLQHTKQQSNSFHLIVEFGDDFRWRLLPLNEFHLPENARQ